MDMVQFNRSIMIYCFKVDPMSIEETGRFVQTEIVKTQEWLDRLLKIPVSTVLLFKNYF